MGSYIHNLLPVLQWDPDNVLVITEIEGSLDTYPQVSGFLRPVLPYHYNCRCSTRPRDPIDRVIFHDPAVIVFWKDGTKTVVKCGPDDTFDAEKGLAMAITKKYLGNKGNYNNIIKKHLREGQHE